MHSTLDAVKKILHIEESTWDDEIQECIVSADGLVDALLKAAGLTVPSPTPQAVSDASAHFAAWLYRRRRDPAGAEVFWQEAKQFLEAYISGEKHQQYGFGIRFQEVP